MELETDETIKENLGIDMVHLQGRSVRIDNKNGYNLIDIEEFVRIKIKS